MPRRRKPHHHRIYDVPFDPSTPFHLQRASYARLSDDDPDTVSIEHQLQANQEHATRRGLVIVAVYIDWRTGVDPDRLAMRGLVQDANAKKHPGVIFYDDTRFHRDVSGAYPAVRLHAHLPEYTFEAARGTYDIEYVGMLATASGRERANTRRRSMEQRRTRSQRGEWMAGMKPYWLDRDEAKQPVIAKDRADAFLTALQIYAAPTGSARAAAEYLTENAPLDPRRNALKEWTSQRFRKLLRNSALWGELPYGRGLDVKESVEGQWAMVTRKRVDNPAKIDFSVPPLIHKSELERTQCRLGGGCERDLYPAGDTLDRMISGRNGKTGGRPYEIEHPLRCVAVLCACGWRVRWQQRPARNSDRRYLYVSCAARMAKGRTLTTGEPCGMPERAVATAARRRQGGGKPTREGVWPRTRAALIEKLRDPVALAEEQRRQVLAEQDIEVRSLAEEARMIEEMDATLTDLSARENRLYRRYDAEEISKVVYDAQSAVIGNERRATEERKRQLLAQRLIVQRAEQAAQDLGSALAELGDIDLESLTDAQWGRVLPDLVESISLDLDGNPSIHWHRPS